jgi:hypothetical protein
LRCFQQGDVLESPLRQWFEILLVVVILPDSRGSFGASQRQKVGEEAMTGGLLGLEPSRRRHSSSLRRSEAALSPTRASPLFEAPVFAAASAVNVIEPEEGAAAEEIGHDCAARSTK